MRMLAPGTNPPPKTRSNSSNPDANRGRSTMATSSSRLTAARLPAKPVRASPPDLDRFCRPAHSSEFQSGYSTHGTPRTDPATWGNLPHNRCRQTLFLPWPRETPEKLMVKAVLIEVSRYPIRPSCFAPITMPSGSLIPDRQLTFSPELAETIGLEEAVLLQERWAPN